MTTCNEIADFCANPTAPLPGSSAKSWLDHAAGCDHCANQLGGAPEAAAEILQCSHQDDEEDLAEVLRDVHGPIMALGTMLAARLSQSDRARLNDPRDIEPLRHEVRYAPTIAAASPAAIRAAVAIAELSLSFEGLVFQREDGDAPPIVIIGGTAYLGTRRIDNDYLVERIRLATGTDLATANALLNGMLDVLGEGILTVPGFTCATAPNRIELNHIDGVDRARFEPLGDELPDPGPWKEI